MGVRAANHCFIGRFRKSHRSPAVGPRTVTEQATSPPPALLRCCGGCCRSCGTCAGRWRAECRAVGPPSTAPSRRGTGVGTCGGPHLGLRCGQSHELASVAAELSAYDQAVDQDAEWEAPAGPAEPVEPSGPAELNGPPRTACYRGLAFSPDGRTPWATRGTAPTSSIRCRGRVGHETAPGASMRVQRRALILDVDGYETPVFIADACHLASRHRVRRPTRRALGRNAHQDSHRGRPRTGDHGRARHTRRLPGLRAGRHGGRRTRRRRCARRTQDTYGFRPGSGPGERAGLR